MELEVKKRLSILLPKKTMTVKTMKATSKRKLYTHIGMRLSTLNIRCPQMEMSAINTNTNTNTSKLAVYQIMIVIHSKLQGSAELALRWQRHPQLLDGKFLSLFYTPSINGHNMEWRRFIVPCFGDEALGSF